MKIITWNINGFRAIVRKEKFQQILELNPDIICFQEIKMNEELIEAPGYHIYYSFAEKKGYSGVAVLTKEEPISVEYEIGHKRFDSEGRIIICEFNDFVLINTYIPNGGMSEEHYNYKLEAIKDFIKFNKKIDKDIVICTDFNIAHDEKDVYNPKRFENEVMFTQKERDILEEFLNIGFIDSFRKQYPDKIIYSWWSNFYNSREKNLGWRIDYIFLKGKIALKKYDIKYLNDYFGSDHCPCVIEFK